MSASADTQSVIWSQASLRGFLHGLPGVDRVGAEARAATLASRSIKTTAKQWALDTAISMIDLTTLEGQDTPGKVRALCAKAKRPDPADPAVPMVAAVCVYPDLAHVAAAELNGSTWPAWPPRSPAGGPAWRSSWPTRSTQSRRAPTRWTW
jgi:deoxyribose-phosphate aldolase